MRYKDVAAYGECRIQIPGFNIAYKIWNENKTNNPVLCLHGKLDNAASFDLLAPELSDFQLVAVDYPGTGFSSPYPKGVIPHWKNDAFLMLHLIKSLKWNKFNIIAHSLGSLLATVIAIALPKQVEKIIFLDILGPKIDFIEKSIPYLKNDATNYLDYDHQPRTLFCDLESALQDRMNIGNISYKAALALVHRGMKKHTKGWSWTFDPRLRFVNSTLPYEDELRTMFNAIQSPVCVIRGNQGIQYPEEIFQGRAESIKKLSIHKLEGGHHIHMDNPKPVAKCISQFFSI